MHSIVYVTVTILYYIQ